MGVKFPRPWRARTNPGRAFFNELGRKSCGHEARYHCACHAKSEHESEPLDCVDFMTRRGRANQVLPAGETLPDYECEA
jgi:hypothetical protein